MSLIMAHGVQPVTWLLHQEYNWHRPTQLPNALERRSVMALETQELLNMCRKMVPVWTFDRKAVGEFDAGNIPGVVHA